MSELEDQIIRVKQVRVDHAVLNETVKALWEEFNARHADVLAAKDSVTKILGAEESKLRELTLAAFRADPSIKKPAPGVGIRMVSVIDYDKLKAFTWAKNHSTCLKLDEKAFEALAKASAGNAMPVDISEIPQATIAKEL